MTKRALDIVVRDELFTLYPEGAAYWHKEEMLIISDLHLGKVTHFRKNGVAVPFHVQEKNFALLKRLYAEITCKTICFLGDLFHSKENTEWERFCAWRAETKSKAILIAGNHDILQMDKYQKAGLSLFSHVEIGPFILTHEPAIPNGKPMNICGHIHPGVKLRGKGRMTLTVSAFHLDNKLHRFVFPACGAFTGKHLIRPSQGDDVFVIKNNQVFRIS